MNQDQSTKVPLPRTEIWESLSKHAAIVASQSLSDMFQSDPKRAANYSAELCGMYVDFSKQRIDNEAMRLLIGLAEQQNVPQKIKAMMSGEPVNTTENRPALHCALRNQADKPIIVDGRNIMPWVQQTLNKMTTLSTIIRNGEYLGYSQKSVKNIVSIGIGGSNLGQVFLSQALEAYADKQINLKFISNIDPANQASVLKGLDPETTLFIVASKTFTTAETIANAKKARAWIVEHYKTKAAVASHFVALSGDVEKAELFGIDPGNIIGFYDWVGGRYSIWGPIGLPVMIAIGPERFRELLRGAHDMDNHFESKPLSKNIPVLLALISIWYRNFLGVSSEAVIPYSYYMRRLPAYLQQLVMESNGKTALQNGGHASYHTSALVWGEPGTDAQHSFFQFLHQGSNIVPVDFIGVMRQPTLDKEQHEMLIANLLAQSQTLAFGKKDDPDDPLNAYKKFPGNRPSTTILLDELEPYTVGALLAMYEHKTFVQAAIWQINPFDQFGVELGKHTANKVLEAIKNGTNETTDSSTEALLRRIANQTKFKAT